MRGAILWYLGAEIPAIWLARKNVGQLCHWCILKSPEWKHTVSTFVDNHCHFFTHDDGGDIDVNMYEIYKNFCDIVDGLFSMTLQDMGVSEEVFADMLADEMRQPDKGPRDKAMKEMLNSLMSFENFQDFRSMMANKATSQQVFVNKHQNSKPLHKGDDESKYGGTTSGQKNNDGNTGKTDDDGLVINAPI